MTAVSDRPVRADGAAAAGRARDAAITLERWCHAREWAGPDPYDGLNARRAPSALLRTPMAKRILTQAVKRSPLDLRPLLGVPPACSSAGLAYALSSYARNGFIPPEPARERLATAIDRLLELRCPGYQEACWSYHFDVQTRVFFYPSTTPNTIATAFVAHALLDAHELAGEARALGLAASAGEFFLRHVPLTEGPGGGFFGYLPGDRTPIHNASMLVAALLARLAGHLHRADMRAAATQALGYTLAHQRADGAWDYGELPHLRWVDGFHTGYVLDCLLICEEAGIDGGLSAWERGLDYYSRHLFLADGTPKYSPGSIYPIDGQCAGQAIQTFARASAHQPERLRDARRVLDFATNSMRRPDGSFVFQRRRRWINRTAHIRWVQGPMLAALTHLIAAEDLAQGT